MSSAHLRNAYLHFCALVNCVLFPLLVLLSATPSFAQTPYKLSPEMALSQDVYKFKLSSDNRRVVYIADQDTDGLDELYMVPLEGGASTKLSHGVFTGTGLPARVLRKTLTITPDSRRVVYIGTGATGLFTIFIVPITGSSTPIEIQSIPYVNLNQPILITPDSQQIIFFSEDKLYSAPIRGGTPLLISGKDNAGEDLLVSKAFILLSHDGQHLVYSDINHKSVYRTPVSGGDSVLLSPMIDADQRFVQVAISPNAMNVVLLAGKSTENFDPETNLEFDYELFVTPIMGGMSSKLNLSRGTEVSSFDFTTDSKGILYSTSNFGALQQTHAVDLTKLQVHSLGKVQYSLANNGSEFAITSANGIFLGSIGNNTTQQLAPSGRLFGFTANDKGLIYRRTNSSKDLIYVVSTSTGRSKLIYEGDHRSLLGLEFPPRESRYAIVRLFTDSSSPHHLQGYFVVSLEDGSSQQLSGNFPRAFTPGEISARRTHYVYLADQESPGRFELFAAEIEIPSEGEFCYVQKVAEKQSIYLCL